MRTFVIVLVPIFLLLASAPIHASSADAVSVVGPASFAAKIVTGADGGFSATIGSCGTKTASTDGVAMLLFDAQESFRFGIGVTGHGSPDRTITQLGPLNDVSVSYPNYGPICPYSSMTITVGGAPFATHLLVAWAAGLDGLTSFSVAGNGASVVVNVGDAIARGDPELESATAQVQLQRRVSGFNGLGVKAIKDAQTSVAIAERAWGFWGYNDAKFVCANVCVGPALADQACFLAARTTCDARIGWSGPAGGDVGRSVFTLLGEPAGAYAFRVEHKVDAYNPGGGAYVPPGVLVFPGENYGFLSLADVSLPG